VRRRCGLLLNYFDHLLSHHTVVWGYLVYCVCFLCVYGYGFADLSRAEKDSGVKLCMLVRLLLDRSSSILVVKGQGHQEQKTRLALSTPTRGAYEWYALAASSVQQQWTGAFRGCGGVTSAPYVR